VLAKGERPNPESTTYERHKCANRIGQEVLALSDPFQRAQQFTLPEDPIDTQPDFSKPWHLQKATKATIVLDFDNLSLQYCAGSASRTTAEQWKTLSVQAPAE